jgi:hypothetical protein
MKGRFVVAVSCVFLAGVVTMPAGHAQVVNRVCQVPGVFTSNGMICVRSGRKLVWARQSPGPTIPSVTTANSAPPATAASTLVPGELPDPCGVVDGKQLGEILGQEVKLSRPQESPQLRTCSIVSSNGFLAGSFAIRNDIEPFLIGGAFISENRWLDPADLNPKNGVQTANSAGKIVYAVRTRQYRTPMWWMSGNGYKYGVVVSAKLSTEEERRVIAALQSLPE